MSTHPKKRNPTTSSTFAAKVESLDRVKVR